MSQSIKGASSHKFINDFQLIRQELFPFIEQQLILSLQMSNYQPEEQQQSKPFSSEQNEPPEGLLWDLKAIKKNPFAFINNQTSRRQLFKICYLLEEENGALKKELREANKRKGEEYRLSMESIQSLDGDVRLEENIKMQNQQYRMQSGLIETYEKKLKQIRALVKKKKQIVAQLKADVDSANKEIETTKEQQIMSASRVVSLEERRDIAEKEMKKQTNQDTKEAKLVDQLMNEYYRTVKNAIGKSKDEEFKLANDLVLELVKQTNNVSQ